MNFTSQLLFWFKNNKRDLPWRETSDPYKIWLSEIILQQTRIVQGTGYYHRFTELFPDIKALALASEDQILAAWQGLGYYSRARNLHHTAKFIVKHHNGIFPKSYSQLLQLKGIGKYTAAAISSIAFNQPYAAVDGNVIRVLTRYFGIEEPFDDSTTRKKIEEIANQLLDQGKPGDFNQALMDFGSMVCKPSAPHCNICPFAQECLARLENKTDTIPVKAKKVKQKERFFHFFLFVCSKNEEITFFIQKREKNDIWRNLYQLPLIETSGSNLDASVGKEHGSINFPTQDNPETTNIRSGRIIISNSSTDLLKNILAQIHENPATPIISYQHQLTHQRIYANFYKVNLQEDYCSIFEKYFLKTNCDEFERLGKPILIAKFMKKLGNSFCI